MGDIYTFISSVSLEKPDWYTQQSLGTMTPICIKCKRFPSSHYQEMKQDLVWETCPWICMWFGNGRAGFWSQRFQTFVLETFKSMDHSNCMRNWQPWWIQDRVTGRGDGRRTEHFAWYSCVLGTAFCRGQGIGPREKLLCASPPACEMGRDDGNDRIVSERCHEWCTVARRSNSHLRSLLRWYHQWTWILPLLSTLANKILKLFQRKPICAFLHFPFIDCKLSPPHWVMYHCAEKTIRKQCFSAVCKNLDHNLWPEKSSFGM